MHTGLLITPEIGIRAVGENWGLDNKEKCCKRRFAEATSRKLPARDTAEAVWLCICGKWRNHGGSHGRWTSDAVPAIAISVGATIGDAKDIIRREFPIRVRGVYAIVYVLCGAGRR